MNPRIGFGYDSHQLKEGIPLILGGVNIPSNFGCVAHSDGDLLIHAIIDALLGAANMRDIGYHFPDQDDDFKNASSLMLLKVVWAKILSKDFEPGNIDATIVLHEPMLSPYIEEMKKNISEAIQVSADRISIKASSNNELGFVGRAEGISAYAVCLLT